MKGFWGTDKNVGDTLTPVLLEALTSHRAEYVSDDYEGKLLMVGSLLDKVKKNDVVLGIGSNKPDQELTAPHGATFLAVRGPLTRNLIKGAEVPEVYGDPALLLPLIYSPQITKQPGKVGVVVHYAEKGQIQGSIDIEGGWQTIVDSILSCELVVSSSLHGIVIAEAYGIPAAWARLSDKIAGGEFKYQDYFLGTGRAEQKPFTVLPPIPDLDKIQKGLLDGIKNL